MYLSNYKNKEGVVIFSAISDDVHASLKIDGNKQEMTFPMEKWKRVTTSNVVEIIEYSDSEGNLWDSSYGTEFRYSYDMLDRELLNTLISFFEAEVEELTVVLKKVEPIIDTLSNKNTKNRIFEQLGNQLSQAKKMIAEIDYKLNPIQDEGCEDECIALEPAHDYFNSTLNNFFEAEVEKQTDESILFNTRTVPRGN